MPDFAVNPRYRSLRFSRAAESYDSVSGVQRRMAKILADLLPKAVQGPVLELGAGTGHLTEHLQSRTRHPLLVTDISLSMIRVCRAKWGRAFHYLVCDATGPLPVREAGVVCANALLQWLDPAQYLSRVHEVLRPKGLLLLASFGPMNFPELRKALASVGIPAGLPGQNIHDVEEVLRGWGYEITESREEAWCEAYPDAMSYLKVLHTLGASGMPHLQVSPGSLRRITGALDGERGEGKPLYMTWQPWWLMARKAA